VTIHPVPAIRAPKNILKLKTIKSKYSAPISERWEIVSGQVDVLHEHDVSTRWLHATEYELKFSEGAVLNSTKVDMFDKVWKRQYVCRDGKLFYEIL
jgi:hypothetical protein